MKNLIVAIYRLVYKITRYKNFSFGFALTYITMLNMILFCGLALLLEGWFPKVIARKLFTFPYYYLVGAAMLGITIRIRPSIKTMSKDAKKKTDYTSIIVYSFAMLLLYVYIVYKDKKF